MSNLPKRPRVSAVAAGMNAQVTEERRRAVAALLRHPLLQSRGPNGDVFPLVRRHAEHIQEWFGRHCGWAVQIESDLARLRKIPADTTDTTRPLVDSADRPFSRGRYVLLCMVLAVLEKSERQTVLCKLAGDIQSRFAMEPRLAELGFTFDVALRDHRRDLIEVVRFLMRMNVLEKVDGDEQQYLTASRDVLYDINLTALAALPSFRRGPSTVAAADLNARLAALVDEPYPDTEDGRNRRLRTRLYRKLLDDPVIYYDQLDDEERTYLIPQRPSIVREIESATGLLPEVRKEGIAMVDPNDEMIDIGMPEEGTDGHVTLLVAEQLAVRIRNDGADSVVAIDELERYVESLVPTHQSHWRKNVREPGAIRLLVADAVARLKMLRLAVVDGEARNVRPLPAIGRFALGEPRTVVPVMKQTDLWGADHA